MLGVYQEYVRNHHYSLQVLAEYKQKEEFNKTLKRCEEKSQCEGRSIESFLTCPMYQVSKIVVAVVFNSQEQTNKVSFMVTAKPEIENLIPYLKHTHFQTNNPSTYSLGCICATIVDY